VILGSENGQFPLKFKVRNVFCFSCSMSSPGGTTAIQSEPMEVDCSIMQPSEETEEKDTEPGMPCQICVCSNVDQTETFKKALASFNVPVVLVEDPDYFVHAKFDGPIIIVTSEFTNNFLRFHKPPQSRILGPTALIEMSIKVENLSIPLRTRIRPLFCHSMQNIVICITGFRNKQETMKLIDITKHMGGKLRKEMNYQVTHLIANCVSGEKYKYAMGFRVPVLTKEFVLSAWEKRYDVNFKADEPSFMNQYKLKLFQGAKVNFFGFSEEDEEQLQELLLSNGGKPSLSSDEPLTTHVVVDDSKVTCMPNVPCTSTYVVKARWFWMSIQNSECADESKYLFGKNFRTPDRAAKRKRLMEVVEEPHSSPRKSRKKRTSDIDGTPRYSCGSLLDYTTSPDNFLATDESDVMIKGNSPRHQVFKELCQTESNYVNVLRVLIEHFKNPLEEKLNTNECILNQAEMKIIFGDLCPIFDTHKDLLKDLKYLEQNYSDSVSIGEVFVKHCTAFKKVYPPFINFFQDSNSLLKEKEKNSRFLAFLKLCYMNLRDLGLPEIDKQTLPDLLIRPVQRLGSISLLLNDILKNTSKSSTDHQKLSEALDGIRTVMTFLNENKQRQDNQRSLFDIYQDIENCPPQLINSHRSFVLKCDVIELSNMLSHRGDCITLFLFTDVVEVCKKRSKYVNVLKSPNTSKMSLSTYKTQAKHPIDKTYKHIKLLSMTSIKKVYNVEDEAHDNDRQIFALRCRGSDEVIETTYSFNIIDDTLDKMSFLRELCRQASAVYCINFDKFLEDISLANASSFNIETHESSNSTLGRAIKFASKQVGRTLSLNRTPSTLRKVMSSMKVRVADT
jgi:RhoGEF, Guanine nucleotide exchange factor for Rho/Rac/Cdc42-like GTPases